MPFTPLGDAINSAHAPQSPLQKQVEAAEIIEIAQKAFLEIFGEELANHAHPQFLKNRTLTVTCGSAALAQEIRLRQKEIVDSINKILGKSEVDRIRYLS